MTIYKDKVRVICHMCNVEHDNEMVYGENKKYRDDFFMKCKHCNNTDEGTKPQNFDIVEFYERI